MIPQTDQRASRPRPHEDPGEVLPKYLSKLEIIESQNSLSRKGPLKVTRSNSPTSHRDTYNSTLGWQCQEPILQSLTPHSVPSTPRPRTPRKAAQTQPAHAAAAPTPAISSSRAVGRRRSGAGQTTKRRGSQGRGGANGCAGVTARGRRSRGATVAPLWSPLTADFRGDVINKRRRLPACLVPARRRRASRPPAGGASSPRCLLLLCSPGAWPRPPSLDGAGLRMRPVVAGAAASVCARAAAAGRAARGSWAGGRRFCRSAPAAAMSAAIEREFQEIDATNDWQARYLVSGRGVRSPGGERAAVRRRPLPLCGAEVVGARLALRCTQRNCGREARMLPGVAWLFLFPSLAGRGAEEQRAGVAMGPLRLRMRAGRQRARERRPRMCGG